MYLSQQHDELLLWDDDLFLLAILGAWLYQEGISTIRMKGVKAADRPYILGTRVMLVVLLLGLVLALKVAWKKRRDVWDRTEAQP